MVEADIEPVQEPAVVEDKETGAIEFEVDREQAVVKWEQKMGTEFLREKGVVPPPPNN